MSDPTTDADIHLDPCHSAKCPCYKQGVEDGERLGRMVPKSVTAQLGLAAHRADRAETELKDLRADITVELDTIVPDHTYTGDEVIATLCALGEMEP